MAPETALDLWSRAPPSLSLNPSRGDDGACTWSALHCAYSLYDVPKEAGQNPEWLRSAAAVNRLRISLALRAVMLTTRRASCWQSTCECLEVAARTASATSPPDHRAKKSCRIQSSSHSDGASRHAGLRLFTDDFIWQRGLSICLLQALGYNNLGTAPAWADLTDREMAAGALGVVKVSRSHAVLSYARQC